MNSVTRLLSTVNESQVCLKKPRKIPGLFNKAFWNRLKIIGVNHNTIVGAERPISKILL